MYNIYTTNHMSKNKQSTKEINIIHRVDIIHILNKWFKLGIWPGGVFFENTVKPHYNTVFNTTQQCHDSQNYYFTI